jgi:hypothetical protein
VRRLKVCSLYSHGVTVKLRTTEVAGAKVAFPGCDAVTVTRPVPVSVTTLPETVAGPATEYVIGRPEVLCAVSVILPTTSGKLGIVENVIVCAAPEFTVSVPFTKLNV